MANSESRNVGYEAHPLFKIYQDTAWNVDRCVVCGGEDLYSKGEGIHEVLMCNDCDSEVDYDIESFQEWCERTGFNPDRLDCVEIYQDSDKDVLDSLIRGMDSNSGKLTFIGVDSNENI
jgi:hypothetical protein